MLPEDKKTLYFITGFLDIVLINILLFQKLNFFDNLLVTGTLGIHLVFYKSLLFDIKSFLDICHYMLFFICLLSIFVVNHDIKLLVIFLLFMIQTLWIYKERCILNELNQTIVFGYGKEFNIVTLLLTMYLCYQLGFNQHLQ